ncbi:MAG TPA: lactate utilization protein [Candidatus Acidoferrum sp.]|nr:lactate utilization protein [Candidatus Acidoferrum sp.]
MERAEALGRERVLARIRSALKAPAPHHQCASPSGPVFVPLANAVERFQRECAANSTELILVPDTRGAADALGMVLASVTPGEIYLQDAPPLRRMLGGLKTDRAVRWSNDGPPSESSQAAITAVECLVAATGSIFIASSAAGRGASVVAPVHIVVASEAQLEPDLAAALRRVKDRELTTHNSALFLITGSSRTADIEKILVLGAHGPRRVVVILARNLD